jgi:hypothetical protein
MTTTHIPNWHNEEIEILDGDESYGYVILGEVAEWLQDNYSDYEEEYGEPAPELTEDHCCEMAADYLEHMIFNRY